MKVLLFSLLLWLLAALVVKWYQRWALRRRIQRVLPKVLKAQAEKAGPQTSCPDDNVLAAFIEGTILPADRDRIIPHLARCDDCLQTIGLVTRAKREEGEKW